MWRESTNYFPGESVEAFWSESWSNVAVWRGCRAMIINRLLYLGHRSWSWGPSPSFGRTPSEGPSSFLAYLFSTGRPFPADGQPTDRFDSNRQVELLLTRGLAAGLHSAGLDKAIEVRDVKEQSLTNL